MAALESRLNDVQQLVECDDEAFDQLVSDLDMKDLLKLVKELQGLMAEEQNRFDLLSSNLRKCKNPADHRQITSALCNCQLRLTILCNRNMRCFTQQAVRTKKDHWKNTKSSSESYSKSRKGPIVTIQKMPSPSVISSDEYSPNVFRESLRFFKSQEEKLKNKNCDPTMESNTERTNETEGIKTVNSGQSCNKDMLHRTSSKSLSVESILNNVRNISMNHDSKETEAALLANRNFCEQFNKLSSHVSQPSSKITPIISQTKSVHKNTSVYSRSSGQPQVKNAVCSGEKGFLSSRFNPTFEPESEKTKTSSLSNTTQNNLHSIISNDSKSREINALNIKSINGQNSITNNVTTIASSKNSNSSESTAPSRPYLSSFNNTVPFNKESTFQTIQRDSLFFKGHCDNSDDASHSELGSSEASEENAPVLSSLEHDCYDEGVDSSSFDKTCDSLESDYDPKDFVVHRTSFSDDFLEVMSEDAYSSVNEDYDVEHPDDLDGEQVGTPSPDYISDEEGEYQVHQGMVECVENDTTNNTSHSQYIADTRRYSYYPEEKELEVIYEVDEEDLELEEEELSPDEESLDKEDICLPLVCTTEKRYNQSGFNNENTDHPKQYVNSQSVFICDNKDVNKRQNDEKNSFNVSSHKPYLSKKDSNDNLDLSKLQRWMPSDWDPSDLLEILYQVDYLPPGEDNKFYNKASYLEVDYKTISSKLSDEEQFMLVIGDRPKMVYVVLKNKTMFIFKDMNSTLPITTFPISEITQKLPLWKNLSQVVSLEQFPVHSYKGHILSTLTSSDPKLEKEWIDAILRNMSYSTPYPYIAPVFGNLPKSKNVLIIDIGGISIRAGLLMKESAPPALFFPSVCLTEELDDDRQIYHFGIDVLKPESRKKGKLSYPFAHSEELKHEYNMKKLKSLMVHICMKLKIKPSDYKVQIVWSYPLQCHKYEIAKLMLEDLGFQAVNVTSSTIAAMHGYRSWTGIAIDMGNKIRVTPIIEGHIIAQGESISFFGANRMMHHLYQEITACDNISLDSLVEKYIARYVLENLCYVHHKDNEQLEQTELHNSQGKKISIEEFFSGSHPIKEIMLDAAQHEVSEGLIDPKKWGLDIPSLPDMIRKALSSSPLECRSKMVQNIYLCGGLSLLPGLPSRLKHIVTESFISKNENPAKVHASPYRYHMPYLGCYDVVNSSEFDLKSLTQKEFLENKRSLKLGDKEWVKKWCV